MNWSYKILKIKGIDIKVHLTFVLILIWAAYRWSITTGEGIQGAIFGIVATVLLFASVLLHELGHSLQALKFGVRVRDITLLPMGGLANIEEMPKDPNKELRISLMGPAVNFIIAALLIGLGLLLDTQVLLALDELSTTLYQVSWSGLLAFLTYANLMLGLFNLIPAFPMDGGRVLRALLAKRMDYSRATQIATQVGQGFALLMGLWGLLSGSWTLVLIAVVVWMGAGQEKHGTRTTNLLGETTVGQVMTRSPYSVKVNDPLSKAVELTLSTSQSEFPVLEWGSNRVAGFLTHTDLLKGLKNLDAGAAVREVMQSEFPHSVPDELISHAHQKMLKSRIKAIPVLSSQGELVGLLSADDITEAYRIMSVNHLLIADPGRS